MKDSGEQLRDRERQREAAALAEAQSLPEIRAALDVDFEQRMATHREEYGQTPNFGGLTSYLAGADRLMEDVRRSRRQMLAECPDVALFDPDRLHGALEFHLGDALRELAAAIDAGTITGRLAGFAGDTVPGAPDRVRFQIKLMVDAPIRSEVR